MELRSRRRLASRNNSISDVAVDNLVNNNINLPQVEVEMEGQGNEGANVLDVHENLPPLQPVPHQAANIPPVLNAPLVDPINQLVAALSGNMNRQPIGEMPKYSDVTKSGLPSTFLSKVEQYARANKWNTIPGSTIEQEMLLAVPLKLSGAAESWYNDLDDSDDAKTSWNGFKDGLITRFTIPGQDAAHFNIYSQRVQKWKEGETVEEYAEALKKLVKNIGNKRMIPECLQAINFINGLEPMLALQMKSKGTLPDTFTEAVMQATLIESAYTQFRAAKTEQRNTNKFSKNDHHERRNRNYYNRRNENNEEAGAAGSGSKSNNSSAPLSTQRPQRDSNDSWKKKVECYKCHKIGHIASECWSKVDNNTERKDGDMVKQERKQQMVRTESRMNPVRSGSKLSRTKLPIKPASTPVKAAAERGNEVSIIVGNVRTVAVLDSGADHNCISIELLDIIGKLAGHKNEIIPMVGNNDNEYYGANGHSIKCLGEIVLSMEHVISAEGRTYNTHLHSVDFDVCHDVRFSVVEGLVSSVLLGDEYMKEHVEHWYHRRGVMQLVNRQVVLFKNADVEHVHQFKCCGSLSNGHEQDCKFKRDDRFKVAYIDDENYIGFIPNTISVPANAKPVDFCSICEIKGHGTDDIAWKPTHAYITEYKVKRAAYEAEVHVEQMPATKRNKHDVGADEVLLKQNEIMVAKPETSVTVPPNTSQNINLVAVVQDTAEEVLFEPKPRKRGLIARVMLARSKVPNKAIRLKFQNGDTDSTFVQISFSTNVMNNTDDAIHFNAASTIGKMEIPAAIFSIDDDRPSSNLDSVQIDPDQSKVNQDRFEMDLDCTHVKLIQPVQTKDKHDENENITNEAIIEQMDKNLTSEQHDKLFALIKKYKRVVAENPKAPKFSSVVEHSIDTGDHPPIKQRSYRTAHQVQQKIREEVNEMLQNGIIRPSNSPWASPVVLVMKKDGSIRFCTDYRKLNAITRKDSYPLPRINETLDVIGKAKWFTSIDFCSGFWQIPVRAEDVPKTAFITRDGLYEYTRMPFGLCNSPSTFQRTMDLLLTGMNNRCALVYIDDILIFSDTFEQHLIDLEELFVRLVESGFSIKLTKCYFGKREVDYLGHTINEHGVSPDKKKLEVISKFPYPSNLTELRSFLGMLNYYNQFIEDFARVAAPLYQLTKKEVKFDMNETHCAAVDELKQKLLTAPILRHPDFELPFIIYTDASNVAVGVVLSQVDTEGQEYVVAYGSRSLSSAERKYTVTERECLAVLFGVKLFRPYIYGTRFTVVTDHGSLTWLFKLRDPEGRLGRWSLKLQGMDMKIEHRAGTKHANADALSRVTFSNKPVVAIQHVYTFTPTLVNVVTRSRTKKDKLLEEHKISSGTNVKTKPPRVASTSTSSAEQKVNPVQSGSIRSDLNADQSGLSWIDPDPVEIKIPPERNKVEAAPLATETKDIHERIRKGQREDKDLNQLINYLVYKKLPDGMDPSRTSRIRILSSSHVMIDNMLHHIFQPTNLSSKHEVRKQLVIPKPMRQEIMTMYHDSYVTGHYGVDRTFQRLNERVYWDTMYQDVYNYCQSCIVCAKRKTPHRTKKLVSGTLPIAAYPWQRISIDVVGPMPVSLTGNSYILVLTDWFTRWVEAWPMKDQKDETICQLIVEEVCCRYGCPEYLHSDRGTNFLSALSTKMYAMFDIHKTATTSYHPQGNGITERANQTLVELLAMYATERDWDGYLPYCLSAIRSAVNSSTMFSPHYLMFAREMRLPTDVLLGFEDTNYNLQEKTDYVDEMEYRMKHAHAKAKEHLESIKNKRDEVNAGLTSLKEFNVGDLVMMYMPQPPANTNAKLYSPWRGPYKVLERVGEVNYIIDLPDEDGRKPHDNVHAARLKLYIDPTSTIPYIAASRNNQ